MMKIEITKEEFQAYERVRVSGMTNMYDVRTVMDLSDLTREKCLAIMEQYWTLMEKYPGVRATLMEKKYPGFRGRERKGH